MIFSGTMILSDLDGTLLDSRGLISPENRAAAEYYTARGGLFSVATGRSYLGMRYFVRELPINAPAVIFNGSMAYDFAGDQTVFFDPLPAQTREMIGEMTAAFPGLGVEVYADRMAYVAKINAITRRHLAYVKIPIVEKAPEEIPFPWVSLVMTLEAEHMEQLIAGIHGKYPDTFFLQRSLDDYLEVQNKRCNKGACALRLCDQLGIRRDRLYVVGDGTNDVELLSCTKNAFAPANAVEAIKHLKPTMLVHNDQHTIADLVGRIEQKIREDNYEAV